MAKEAKTTKTQAEKAVNGVTETITNELKRGGKITLPGFATFSAANRKSRTGRNPRTGQEIKIPARRTARFKPGKALKEAVR